MSRPDREVVERLGRPGLRLALADILDHGRIVRLANACALSYPGIRNQSQKRERLLEDLAEKACVDDAARKTVLRTLRKETLEAVRDWSSAPAAQQEARLEEASRGGSADHPGLLLFLVADGPDQPRLDAALAAMRDGESAPAPQVPGPVASVADVPSRETSRLRKRATELQKKVQYLDGQIAKNRETEKSLKRDLIERKGELAEARMLIERLRKEAEAARGAAAASAPKSGSPDGPIRLEEIDRGLKRLVADQRKLAHRIEKMAEAPPVLPSIPPETLAPLGQAVDALKAEVAALRRERRKDLQDQSRRLDDLHAAVKAAQTAAEASPRSPRSAARRKDEPERVAVFIDVQNMYYAARQLKGKLDFDALLQAAVRDRRLIRASAYVVESKDTDQYGFLNMLQQRAIEVRRKTLKVRSDGSMKGDWDMEMALDILDAAPKLDVVVLVSGDGDFTSLVQRVKGLGPRVEVLAFPRNTAKSLLEAADLFTPLDRKFMIRREPLPETPGADGDSGAADRATERPTSGV